MYVGKGQPVLQFVPYVQLLELEAGRSNSSVSCKIQKCAALHHHFLVLSTETAIPFVFIWSSTNRKKNLTT